MAPRWRLALQLLPRAQVSRRQPLETQAGCWCPRRLPVWLKAAGRREVRRAPVQGARQQAAPAAGGRAAVGGALATLAPWLTAALELGRALGA